MLTGAPVHEVAHLGAERGAGPGGLEAEDSAARGRDTDGTPGVVGVGERHQACRNGRRGTAAGPAGGPAEVPRVARGTVPTGFGRGQDTELGRVAPAKNEQSAGLEPLDQRTVLVGDEARQQTGPLRGLQSGAGCPQVLEQEGHAGQWPRWLRSGERSAELRGTGLLPGPFVVGDGHRADRGVRRLDPSDRGLDQFVRTDLPRPDHIGLGVRVEPCQFLPVGHPHVPPHTGFDCEVVPAGQADAPSKSTA
ncbi:hypothetical protein GCM10010389_40800 [Streptomyces echinoruber]|uniref:Uncharacterized protein n=1 Tax=Streptomyces echinoruber TaxID=68898 RepID=A0A918RG38_9ACTN|nr:hypothetical protein GCM10010389_40800 [Streptomyces echinoruber]